jgi:L-iditol 2-dehydrogenase
MIEGLDKKSMRVLMYYSNHDVRVEEMSVPETDRNELLMRVIASGICGSDVMEWYRIKKAPRVLGHEIAGDIVKVGEKVKKYKVGDSISLVASIKDDSKYRWTHRRDRGCE